MTDQTSRQRRRSKRQPTFQSHYPNLLVFCYLMRYVTASIVFRSYRNFYRSERTAQYQLNSLKQLGYLKTAPRHSVNAPFVYSSTPKGIRCINDQFGKDFPLTREETVTPWLINHELATSEFQADVRMTVNARADLSVRLWQRRYYRQQERLTYRDISGNGQVVIPDLGFLVRLNRSSGQRFLLHLAEVDMSTETPSVFLSKLLRYDTWHAAAGRDYLTSLYRHHGATDPQPTYRRLVIVNRRRGNDVDRLAALFTQALKLPETTRNNIFFTTGVQLAARRHEPAPLDAPIWVPARCARSWICDVEGDINRMNKQKHVYKSVAEHIAEMNSCALFPPVEG